MTNTLSICASDTSGGNVSEMEGTKGYTTSSATSGYTFVGGEYITLAVTGKGVTSRPTTEIMKQYTVASGSSGSNALTYAKDADGSTTTYAFDWLGTGETISLRAWSDGKTTTPAAPATDPDGQLFTIETTQAGSVRELLYSPAADYSYATASGAINIPLYHQLARVVVNIRDDATGTPTLAAVTLGSATDKVPVSGTFTKPTSGNNFGSWAVASEATQSTHWGVITPKAETAATGYDYTYSAVAIPGGPMEYAAGGKLINITIGSETFSYEVPGGGITLAAGKQYNYNITVKNQTINVETVITDWNDVADAHTSYIPPVDIRKNPLWYVAESNVKSFNAVGRHVTLEPDPTTTGSSFCFNWADAMSYFARQSSSYNVYWEGDITDDSARFHYHLPVQKEWLSVLPTTSNVFSTTDFWPGGGLVGSAASCIFGYDSTTQAGLDDWSYWSAYTADANVRYAIRFLGTDYCSVWKYQFSGSVMTITAKLIDCIQKDDAALATRLSDYIARDAAWWNDNTDANGGVQRKFSLVGYYYNGGTGGSGVADVNNGSFGYHWSATAATSSNSIAMIFGGDDYLIIRGTSTISGLSVRLFRDNLTATSPDFISRFTVDGSGTTVEFAPGNLQATTADLGATWTWSFAPNPWDRIGNAAANNAINGNGTVSTNGTVDLFGWSTAATYYGIHNSTTPSIYSGDFVDWGTNPDLESALGAGWRTLTSAEWTHLLRDRTTTSGIRYAKATVNSVTGIILLPDDWNTAYYTLASTNMAGAAYTTNQISESTWNSSFAPHGAVFLPTVGMRNGASISYVDTHGYYWSSTLYSTTYAYHPDFVGSTINFSDNSSRGRGYAVRLVRNSNSDPDERLAPVTTVDNILGGFSTDYRVGDVVCQDGSIYRYNGAQSARQQAELSGRKPVGVIVYTCAATPTQTDLLVTEGRGHALVMGIADIGIYSYACETGDSGSHVTANGWMDEVYGGLFPNVLQLDQRWNDFHGLEKTEVLGNLRCDAGHLHEAFTQILSWRGTHGVGFGASPWFIASSGQWMAAFQQIIASRGHTYTAAKEWNAVVQDWTDIKAVVNTRAGSDLSAGGFWTSSEYGPNDSDFLGLFTDFSDSQGIRLAGGNKFVARKIRPFLAF